MADLTNTQFKSSEEHYVNDEDIENCDFTALLGYPNNEKIDPLTLYLMINNNAAQEIHVRLKFILNNVRNLKIG